MNSKRSGKKYKVFIVLITLLIGLFVVTPTADALSLPKTWVSEPETVVAPAIETLLYYKKATLYPDREDLTRVSNAELDKEFIYKEAIGVPTYEIKLEAQDNANEERMQRYDDEMPRSEAIEDIHYLANILRKGFAGLNLFGGKEAVIEMEKHAISVLPERGMTYRDFEDLLILETGFIEDMHFWVDYQASVLSAEMRSVFSRWQDDFDDVELRVNKAQIATNFRLKRLANGEYFDLDEEKTLELSDDFPAQIEPFMSDDFSIHLTLVQVSNYRPLKTLKSVRYKDGSEKAIKWDTIYDNYLHTEQPGGVAEVFDNVYYVDLRGYVFRDPWEIDFGTLAKDSLSYPYMVVDLRGNTGGKDIPFESFLQNLFRYDGYNLFDRAYYRVVPITPTEYADSIRDGWQDQLIGENISFLPPEPRVLTSPHKLVVILMDNGTASAGEYAVGSFRSGENVIVIGANTQGLATSSVGELYVLPHSRIPLRIPMLLNYWHPDYYSVNEGFRPDIWTYDFDVSRLIDYLNAQAD
jgi:hypothetical protein